MKFADYFQRDPGICGGETVLRGTRVTVRTVLASLAEGSSFQEILQDYPSLSEEHVRAVVAFAATSAREDLPVQISPAANPSLDLWRMAAAPGSPREAFRGPQLGCLDKGHAAALY